MKEKEEPPVVNSNNQNDLSQAGLAWLGKNSSKICDLIEQDNSLSKEDKTELIKEFSQQGNSIGSKNDSNAVPKKFGYARSKSHNPEDKKNRPQLTKSLDLNTITRDRSSSLHFGKKHSSQDGDKSPQRSLVGSPSSSPLGSPGRSPGRSVKKMLVSSGGLIDSNIKKESPRKKTGWGLFSHSDPVKKITISDSERSTKSLIMPIESSVAESYRKHAMEKFKGKTIIVLSPDKKYELMVNEVDKEAYLLDLDPNNMIGKGGFAKICPGFNLRTHDAICAKVYYQDKAENALDENKNLVLIDNFFMKNFKKRRHFGFYHSEEEKKYVLLKNYETGINLQDFLYEINPEGDEYNLCFKKDEVYVEKNTLYLECDYGSLQYTVITPQNQTVSDSIKQENFKYCQFSKDLAIEQLLPFMDKLLDLTAQKGHTHPKYYLNKKTIEPFLLLKIIYKIMEQVNLYHECGIVLTDINPRNIIIDITPEGEPVIGIIDFDSAFSLEMVHGYQLVMKKAKSTIEKDIIYIEIKKNTLQYTVMDKEGKARADFIEQKDLMLSLHEDMTEDQLKRYLPKILAITHKRKHTYPGHGKNVWTGETPGYLPPTVERKPWPKDISYDIWPLLMVIAGTITDIHIPDLIKRMHFENYPNVPTVPIMLEMLDDVSAKRKQKQIAEPNIINIMYNDIIFPVLSELVHSMIPVGDKEFSLIDEIINLKLFEKKCFNHLERIHIMFEDSIPAKDSFKAILDMTHKEKYNTKLQESYIEPQVFTKMLSCLFELIKTNLEESSNNNDNSSFII